MPDIEDFKAIVEVENQVLHLVKSRDSYQELLSRAAFEAKRIATLLLTYPDRKIPESQINVLRDNPYFFAVDSSRCFPSDEQVVKCAQENSSEILDLAKKWFPEFFNKLELACRDRQQAIDTISRLESLTARIVLRHGIPHTQAAAIRRIKENPDDAEALREAKELLWAVRHKLIDADAAEPARINQAEQCRMLDIEPNSTGFGKIKRLRKKHQIEEFDSGAVRLEQWRAVVETERSKEKLKTPPATQTKAGALPSSQKWECAHCSNEVESDRMPNKCPKCGRSGFTRIRAKIRADDQK